MLQLFGEQLANSGLDLSGEITVLAPCDTAMAGKVLDIDTLLYHIIPGYLPKDSISGDVPTCYGKNLTYKRFARKTFLDDAVIGITPEGPATGQYYPVDVPTDYGLIHTIDRVLEKDWTKLSGDAGLGGIA